MPQYDRIDISEGININKTSYLREFKICHYWHFNDIDFKYEPYLCNGCLALVQRVIRFSYVAIIYVKGSAYRICFWYISKDHGIGVINNFNLIDKIGVL